MQDKMNRVQYNQLPRPTFRWMRVNHLELDPLAVLETKTYMPLERHEGDVTVALDGAQIPDLGDFKGSNEEALAKAKNQCNTSCAIHVDAGKKGTVWLTYSVSDDVPQINGNLSVVAEDGSDVTVYLLFDGGAEGGAVNFLTYVKTGAKGHVKISKVQLHDKSVRHIEHRYGDAGKESTIEYVNAEVGAQQAIVYYKTDLLHDESNFNSQAMYLGDDDQIIDFSYWVPTQGVKTNTDINTTGALLDKSKKYFRGTIDFLRGGKQAIGSESDTCILLSPNVHSISVPLLLCKEDDVVGNHASSAGQIDKDKLFYLMSRGFNQEGAQLIIVESNIRPVIDAIGDKDLANKALQAVREKMQFCNRKGDCNAKCTQRFPNLD